MSKEKIPYKVAEQELRDWVTAKHGNDQSLESEGDATIKSLVSLMQQGRLILKEDGGCEYVLKYPIMGEVDGKETAQVTTISFKSRVKYKQIKSILRRINPEDRDGRVLAYTCAYTSQPMPILEEFDLSDITKVQMLTGFFIAE